MLEIIQNTIFVILCSLGSIVCLSYFFQFVNNKTIKNRKKRKKENIFLGRIFLLNVLLYLIVVVIFFVVITRYAHIQINSIFSFSTIQLLLINVPIYMMLLGFSLILPRDKEDLEILSFIKSKKKKTIVALLLIFISFIFLFSSLRDLSYNLEKSKKEFKITNNRVVVYETKDKYITFSCENVKGKNLRIKSEQTIIKKDNVPVEIRKYDTVKYELEKDE